MSAYGNGGVAAIGFERGEVCRAEGDGGAEALSVAWGEGVDAGKASAFDRVAGLPSSREARTAEVAGEREEWGAVRLAGSASPVCGSIAHPGAEPMLSIGASTKVFLRPGPTDLRLGFEGLYSISWCEPSYSRILFPAMCLLSATRRRLAGC